MQEAVRHEVSGRCAGLGPGGVHVGERLPVRVFEHLTAVQSLSGEFMRFEKLLRSGAS